jgi:hypothetical protein
LAAETAAIIAHQDQKAEAERRYSNARTTKWFEPVVSKLCKQAGPGGRCMFCSGSEASDIEHYKPLAVFHGLAMTWKNYLWSCTPCNRNKSNRFPPDTEPGGKIINPIDEDVWDFFFIDKFGFITPIFDTASGLPNPRAVNTRDILDLNRQAVQESRRLRYTDLCDQIEDNLELHRLGQMSKRRLKYRIKKWRHQPFQPDVADYFLNGPGVNENPFRSLFAAVA